MPPDSVTQISRHVYVFILGVSRFCGHTMHFHAVALMVFHWFWLILLFILIWTFIVKGNLFLFMCNFMWASGIRQEQIANYILQSLFLCLPRIGVHQLAHSKYVWEFHNHPCRTINSDKHAKTNGISQQRYKWLPGHKNKIRYCLNGSILILWA